MTRKKSKGKKANTNIQGKDNLHRMNFLYQAAHHALESGMSADISANLLNNMCCIGRKSQMKIEPLIKRGICKGCCLLLQPGISARVRLRKAMVIWTCLRCGTRKRFPTKRGYKLWIENEDSCLELLEYPSVYLENTAQIPIENSSSPENIMLKANV